MAAGSLIFVRFTLTAVIILLISTKLECSEERHQKGGGNDVCNKTTQQMLTNPCSHLELEVSTSEKPKMSCGTEIQIEVFANHIAPKIGMQAAKPDKFYTLIMMDPDAPNHKFPKYWLHWLCVNIKGKDLVTSAKVNCPNAIAAYTPPTPPPNSGLHRYQIFLYEQRSGNLNVKAPTTRAQFDAMKFVNDLGLCGPPSAAFEFKTQAATKE